MAPGSILYLGLTSVDSRRASTRLNSTRRSRGRVGEALDDQGRVGPLGELEAEPELATAVVQLVARALVRQVVGEEDGGASPLGEEDVLEVLHAQVFPGQSERPEDLTGDVAERAFGPGRPRGGQGDPVAGQCPG